MKKILIMIMAVAFISSCGKDEILIPESLFIEETALTLVAEGETYMNRFYTTTDLSAVKVEVPNEAKEWLSVTVDGKYLKIEAARNNSIGQRSTTVAIKTNERSEQLSVVQSGLPTRLLKITGGKCTSSAEPGEGSFAGSFDGDYTTYWHSQYPTNQYVNQVLEYDLAPGSGSLDLIMLYARKHTAAANGRWGYYCIYVKGDGTSVPSEIPGEDIDWQDGVNRPLGSVDADGYKLMYKGDESPYYSYNGQHVASVVLPVPVANPTSIRILIKCGPAGSVAIGRSGYGSLGEIELYGKAN
ncbi:MAG: hypothetical protein LBQ73_05865 [Tannerellaceae bacterium]|jgi:hypothetical protein|nr:hypothetical protein [Tannerellaceae bacterium]